MLTLSIIFCVIATAFAVTYFIRRTDRPSEMHHPLPPAGAEHFRPLFAPSEEDLRSAELEKVGLQNAEIDRVAARKKQHEAAELETLCTEWQSSPTKAKTISLLSAAAKSENEDIYLRVCNDVLRVWRAGSVGDLSANDLAQLLESHYWLFPADKRTAGVSFLLNAEIAGLRSGSFHNK